MPYAVGDATIHDVPLDPEKPLTFTRALKYVATNVKWLLPWAARARRGQL